jgi:TonB family protein
MRTLLCALFLLVLPMASVADGKPGATAGAGFTDTALGFDRLPKEGARYRDGDFEVAGGADPRWSPWNPLHMEIARRRAEQAGTSLRRLTNHPYLLSLRGDREGAEAGLAKARAQYPNSVALHWSEGWIRLNLLDFEGALVAWQQAERLHGGQPFWVPYTKAIALVGVGDDTAALAWWQVAQRALAPDLDTATDARQRFSHWRVTEKILLEELIQFAYPRTAPAAIVDGRGYLQMTHAPVPMYPVELLRQGIEGTVLVKLKVGQNGLPGQVRIERSSGYPAFDEEALKVAKLARFELPQGATKPVWALVPYRFGAAPGGGAATE